MCYTFRSWLTCIPHMFSVNTDTCLKTVWFCSNTCISLVVTVGYWCKCVYIFKFFIWLTRMCSSSWTCYWLDIVWFIFGFIWLTCMCSSSWTCYWLDIVWLIFVFIWLTCMCSSPWTCYWLDLVWLIFVFICWHARVLLCGRVTG